MAKRTPARLKSGKWSAVKVLVAFAKRSVIAQKYTNCLTDFFLHEALLRADELDSILEATGKPVGPLHGLPFSIKDVFDIAGHDTTAGVVSWIGKIPTTTAPIVQYMIDAGAIPFVKTNISQGCRLVESQNNIWGTVNNPHNLSLSAGGSSGGEGALVAMRGSPLGIGTDGGGSIRIPAAWNGVYGFKPSAQRFPKQGVRSPGISDSNSGSAIGPFATDLHALELWCQTMLAAQPWLRDPECLPIPWREITIPKKLKIGLLVNDGVIHPSPPVQRVLSEVATELQLAGHEVIVLDWAALHYEGSCIIMKMYTEDGGMAMEEALNASGEPVVPRVCTGSSERLLSPKEIWENKRAGKEFWRKYALQWRQAGVDVLITAASPHAAPPHGQYVSSAISAVYNLLDYPCCIIPYGAVDQIRDTATQEWRELPPNKRIPDFPYDGGDEEMKTLSTGPQVFENAPLAIQIVAPRLQDEFCLAAANVIDRVLRARLNSQ